MRCDPPPCKAYVKRINATSNNTTMRISIAVVFFSTFTEAFIPRCYRAQTAVRTLAQHNKEESEALVDVKSKEYLDGFVQSPIVDPTLLERDPLGGLSQVSEIRTIYIRYISRIKSRL
jgi:hypothetical protein